MACLRSDRLGLPLTQIISSVPSADVGSVHTCSLDYDAEVTSSQIEARETAFNAVSNTIIERVVAVLILLTLLLKVPGYSLVPLGALSGIMLILVTWRHLRGKRLRFLVWGTGLALFVGLAWRVLNIVSSAQPASLETFASVVLWLLAFPLVIAAGLWGLSKLTPRFGMILIALGAMLGSLATAEQVSWKGTLGIYVAMLLLLLVASSASLSAVALTGIAAVSAAADARSMAVVAGVSLVVMVFTRRNPGGRARTFWMLGLIAAVGVAAIWAMSLGLFGESVQQRTLNQLTNPVFIFGGARVEFAATIALASANPLGYGVAMSPSSTDVAAGIDAVRLAGGDWTAPYFMESVFASRVDLHSTVSNLWFHFGFGGLLFAILLLVLLLRNLAPAAQEGRRILGMAAVFAILIGLWDMLFSPMGNSDRIIFAVLAAATAFSGRSPFGAESTLAETTRIRAQNLTLTRASLQTPPQQSA